MVQNPWLVFPQFCAFLKDSLLTVRLCGKNSWCFTPLQSKKTVSKTLHLTELDVLFSVLALLDACIGMIGLSFQCHSHTSIIRQQLRAFDFFFAKIVIFCISIAGPLPSVVQAYTQPYSFSGRIKLIICQIRHELSDTIHKISTSWKKRQFVFDR